MATTAIGQGAIFGMGLGAESVTAGSAPQARAQRNRELFEAQRRARRGPTPEVFFAKHIDNTRIVKADDPERRREMRIFSIAMTTLFVLVMVYVWQHFSAIEVGYQVETQKQQMEQLREQNRQLRLAEEQLTNPARIDQIAQQLGMDIAQPGQVVRPDGSSNNGAVLAQTATPSLQVN